ncbi:MAG: hypothetical protein AAGF26_07215 [Cyanobacteria bacterium P01_G01_bin.49]
MAAWEYSQLSLVVNIPPTKVSMSRPLRFFMIFLFVSIVTIAGCNFLNVSQKTTDEFSPKSNVPEKISDSHYITVLGLMQGHLVAARDLLDGGTPDQAQYHLDHPLDELFGEIKPKLELEGVNTTEFYNSLDNLYSKAKFNPYSQEIKSKPWKSVTIIQSTIDSFVQKKFESSELNQNEFVQKVLLSILETAAVEYEAGIGKNCKIIAPIEYQDSFGFVKYIEEELLREEQGSWIPNSTKEKFQPIVKNLLDAWSPGEPFKGNLGEAPNCLEALSSLGNNPSVYPPEYPVMAANQVHQLIAEIKKDN